jgi:LacI family transcriptional regulator, galactose operon repressor
MPSLRMLCEEYGVGQKTVRQAVELLKLEGRIRINANRRMVAARSKATTSATEKLLLLVVSDDLQRALQRNAVAGVLRGVQSAVGAAGASLLILSGKQFARSMPSDAFSLPLWGVVLAGGFSTRLLRRYDRLAIPVAVADSPIAGFDKLHSVSVDNRSAVSEALEHLLSRGHRRIAFMRHLSLSRREIDPDSREREECFHATLEKAGLPRSEHLVLDFFFTQESGQLVSRKLAEATPPVTALLSTGTASARGVRKNLLETGRRVPEDISLVCFGVAGDPNPGLSGPRIDFEAIGRRAVEIIEQSPKEPAHVRVPTSWHPGETIAESQDPDKA